MQKYRIMVIRRKKVINFFQHCKSFLHNFEAIYYSVILLFVWKSPSLRKRIINKNNPVFSVYILIYGKRGCLWCFQASK
jgi:hypothetical protein